jgi:hypothetical protein
MINVLSTFVGKRLTVRVNEKLTAIAQLEQMASKARLKKAQRSSVHDWFDLKRSGTVRMVFSCPKYFCVALWFPSHDPCKCSIIEQTGSVDATGVVGVPVTGL